MISIHIVSLIVGLIVGVIGGTVITFLIDKSLFFDERYWAGWGKGFNAGYKHIKEEKKEG